MLRALTAALFGTLMACVIGCPQSTAGGREGAGDSGSVTRATKAKAQAAPTYGTVLVVNDANWEPEVIAASKESTVVVDMWATWCGPCKVLAPVMDQIAADMPNVKFTKVDVDQNKADDPFGIQAIPTLLIIKDGKEVHRLVGPDPRNKSALSSTFAKYT